jgi:hypothetical protein
LAEVGTTELNNPIVPYLSPASTLLAYDTEGVCMIDFSNDYEMYEIDLLHTRLDIFVAHVTEEIEYLVDMLIPSSTVALDSNRSPIRSARACRKWTIVTGEFQTEVWQDEKIRLDITHYRKGEISYSCEIWGASPPLLAEHKTISDVIGNDNDYQKEMQETGEALNADPLLTVYATHFRQDRLRVQIWGLTGLKPPLLSPLLSWLLENWGDAVTDVEQLPGGVPLPAPRVLTPTKPGAPMTAANAWAVSQFEQGRVPQEIRAEYARRYDNDLATPPDKALRDLFRRWQKKQQAKEG